MGDDAIREDACVAEASPSCEREQPGLCISHLSRDELIDMVEQLMAERDSAVAARNQIGRVRQREHGRSRNLIRSRRRWMRRATAAETLLYENRQEK